MKSLFTTFAFLILSLIAYGQNTEFAKLDSFFTVLEENNRFFGSVAIADGGEIIYRKAIGFADLETKAANNKDTKFRIGSISKTFTATLLMKAAELGKVELDRTIEAYFPRIQNADKITVRQLLNHRSGIANFTDRNYVNWHTEPITQAALLDTIIAKGIDFEPNTDYAYSNSKYELLTFILEKAFDNTYDQILDQYIVKPLELTNTHYGAAINTSANEAKSYYMDAQW
ncbi:MAG: serine hydrolase domain-containing protein, partial [Bacteroidota bacterium]